MTWTLRSFSWADPTTPLGSVDYDDETYARKAFEAACVHAREHGGWYELLRDGVLVSRLSVMKGGSGS